MKHTESFFFFFFILLNRFNMHNMYTIHSTLYRTAHRTTPNVQCICFIFFLLYFSLCFYSGSLFLFCSAASVKLSALCIIRSSIYSHIHSQYYRDVSLFYIRLLVRWFVQHVSYFDMLYTFVCVHKNSSVGKNITVCVRVSVSVSENKAAAVSVYLYGVSIRCERVRFYLFI